MRRNQRPPGWEATVSPWRVGLFPGPAFPVEAPGWYYVDSSASVLGPAAAAAAFELAMDTAGDVSIVTAFQADLTLGDPSTFRALWGISTDVDTNGTFYQLSRDTPDGEVRAFLRTDAGADIIDQLLPPVTAAPGFDGRLHLFQMFDSAVSPTLATVSGKLDSDPVDLFDATYTRGLVGQLDVYSIASALRGPIPTLLGSLLGWVYLHILVTADLEPDSAAIAAAFTTSADMETRCDAVIDAIEAAGHTSSIVYAQVFKSPVAPRYGTAAARQNVTLTPAGNFLVNPAGIELTNPAGDLMVSS